VNFDRQDNELKEIVIRFIGTTIFVFTEFEFLDMIGLVLAVLKNLPKISP